MSLRIIWNSFKVFKLKKFVALNIQYPDPTPTIPDSSLPQCHGTNMCKAGNLRASLSFKANKLSPKAFFKKLLQEIFDYICFVLCDRKVL